MIVAARTRNRLSKERLRDHIDLLVGNVDAFLLFVGLREHLWPEREKPKCCEASACSRVIVGGWICRLRDQIARNLLGQKLIERNIAIERVDHVVAIAECVRVGDVLVDTVRIGIARDIEPVPTPALTVHRVFEKRINATLVGVGRAIGLKRRDFFG